MIAERILVFQWVAMCELAIIAAESPDNVTCLAVTLCLTCCWRLYSIKEKDGCQVNGLQHKWVLYAYMHEQLTVQSDPAPEAVMQLPHANIPICDILVPKFTATREAKACKCICLHHCTTNRGPQLWQTHLQLPSAWRFYWPQQWPELHMHACCSCCSLTGSARGDVFAAKMEPSASGFPSGLQMSSNTKNTRRTFSLLYIAAFPCTPNCPGIMSQLITGNYVIEFQRNSFRVQVPASATATCFASAQPKAQVSGGVDCVCLCLPSKWISKSQTATTLAFFLADCTENRGLLVAQALFQLTAMLAQQASSLSSVKMLWLTAHCFVSQTGYYTRKLACFHRQHCPLEACLPMAFACCCAANLPSCWQQVS